MALTEEQQEWLAAQAEDLAQRISGLARRHAELTDARASLQPTLPVSRQAALDPRVRSRLICLPNSCPCRPCGVQPRSTLALAVTCRWRLCGLAASSTETAVTAMV